jgi:hypothetical protein
MKTFPIALAAAMLAACASPAEPPAKPGPIGMANPASVYCAKLGGKLDIVKERDGEVGYCTLPSGERIEEWALFRRDHP